MAIKPDTISEDRATNPCRSKLTRQDQLNKLLSRKSGATISQIQKAFGWQPHTARAAISAQRKAGYVVEKNKEKGKLVYRIVREV